MSTKKSTILVLSSLAAGALLFWFAATVLLWHKAYLAVIKYNAAVSAQQKNPQP